MTEYIIESSTASTILEQYPELDENALLSGDGTIHLPATNQVCERCHGEGTHDHPAFSNGFSRDDDFVDDDFISDYREGRYDVPCDTCCGKRVVPVVDENKLTPLQKKAWQAYLEFQREDYLSRMAEAAERRMGA